MLNLSEPGKTHPTASILLTGTVLLILFADTQTQLGFAHGVLFTPLIVLAGFTGKYPVLHGISILSVASLWLGYLLSPAAPAGFSTYYVLANRGLATLAILLLWLLAANAIKVQRQQQQHALQERQIQRDLNLAGVVAALSHWHLDNYQKMITLDAASQTLLGMPGTKLTLEQFVCCFEEKSQNAIKRHFRKCLEKQQGFTFETKLHAEAAQPIWVKLVAYPDPDNPELVRGLLQNIEQNYQKTHLLAEQQQRFKQLADSLPVKVWTATADGIIDFAANTFASFCGRNVDTIVTDWLSMIHPDDRAHTLAAWQQAVNNRLPYKVEFRILRADGSYCWHLTSAVPIFNDEGQVVCWFGSALDTSEQKALWLKTDQLKQSLYLTLESISDGFFTLDQHLRFTYLNQSAAELLAPCRQPAPGKLLTDVFYLSGKDFSPLTMAIQRAFLKQQTEHVLFTFPGTALPIYFSLYPSEQGVSVLMQPQLRADTKMTAVAQSSAV